MKDQIQTFSHLPIFFFVVNVPDSTSWGQGTFQLSGIQLCKKAINSREYPDIFAFPGRLASCVTFSESVQTLHVKWSTCLFPVEMDPLGAHRKGCWSIHGGQADPSLGIKVTLIEIYIGPCCNRWQWHHIGGEFRCYLWESWLCLICITLQMKGYDYRDSVKFLFLKQWYHQTNQGGQVNSLLQMGLAPSHSDRFQSAPHTDRANHEGADLMRWLNNW